MDNTILKRFQGLNLRMFFLALCAFQICPTTIHARTELSGTIAVLTISADKNPIIIKENLIIPKNGHITIEKGCMLFFKPFTGIIVEGSLSIEGTPEERVIFTSINDSLNPERTGQPANPFDWNGILVIKQAQNISLKNFIIKYSVYGIKSQNANMTIDNGIFNGNGQFNCTVNDKIMPVVDNLAFNYKTDRQVNTSHEKDQTGKTTWLLPAAIATTVVGAVGLCIMAYSLNQRSNYISLYNSATTQNERTDYFEKQKSQSKNAIIYGISGGVLLATGGVLFIVDHNQKKERTISLRPIIGSQLGMAAAFEF